MRQFDVYENPSDRSRQVAPYLIVLSSHLLSDLSVVIVAPLVRDRARAVAELELAVKVAGEPLIMTLTDLAGLERQALKTFVVSLSDAEDAIRRALDRLFTGF